MGRVIGILIAILFITESLFAGAGTVYSRFGIGDRYYFGSARSMALGGVAIALRGGSHLNRINPATWADLSVVQFSGSLFYEGIMATDGSHSSTLGNGTINGALLALPVKPSRGITIMLGFSPMTNVSYDIENTVQIEGGSQHTSYRGTGGITNGIFGISYKLANELNIGGTLLYRRGILQYDWRTEYTLPEYISGSTHRTLSLGGIAGTFGIVYSGVLPKRQGEAMRPLTLGFIFTTPSHLNAEEDFTISYATGIDTTIERSGTINLPYNVGIGVSYSIDRQMTIALDVRYEPWENFRIFGDPDPNIRNAFRFGVGWEHKAAAEPGDSFLRRIDYRLGFLYNASYFNINNTPINETYITAGVGIPISPVSLLNIGAQIGFRGTASEGMQRDRLIRIFFELNMFERWFVPPTRE